MMADYNNDHDRIIFQQLQQTRTTTTTTLQGQQQGDANATVGGNPVFFRDASQPSPSNQQQQQRPDIERGVTFQSPLTQESTTTTTTATTSLIRIEESGTEQGQEEEGGQKSNGIDAAPPSLDLFEEVDGGEAAVILHEQTATDYTTKNDSEDTKVSATASAATGTDTAAAAKRINLRSIMDHKPVESQAEAHIQIALDEMDPTRSFTEGIEETILGYVPAEAKPSTFADEYPSKSDDTTLPMHRQHARKRSGGGHHRRTKSVSEALRDLTYDLKGMQQEQQPPFYSELFVSGSVDGVKTESNATARVDAAAQSCPPVASTLPATPTPADCTDKDEIFSCTDHPQRPSMHTVQSTTDTFDSNINSKNDWPSSTHSSTNDSDEGGNDGVITRYFIRVKAHYKDFEDWLKSSPSVSWPFFKTLLMFVAFGTSLAAVLFYVAGNPPCQNGICSPSPSSETGTTATTTTTSVATVVGSASASWWMLFFVRQSVTFAMACVTASFIIEYLALRTEMLVRTVGALATLFVVQSKGIPITLFLWGVFDFALLYGRHPYAKHWLYWQSEVDLMNATNPAGTITESSGYTATLIIAVVCSFFIALKRCVVGLLLGRQTYLRYGQDLATLMAKAVLIGKVASLAREIEVSRVKLEKTRSRLSVKKCRQSIHDARVAAMTREEIIGSLGSSSSRLRISELIGEWEEPAAHSPIAQDNEEAATIKDIIQFRQSLTCLSSSVPFSAAFGSTTNRQECVARAEAVYNRLLLGGTSDSAPVLSFNVIASIAVRDNGHLEELCIKELIQLFRPDRQGRLTLLDFAKSIDSVYKELRLLRASISNSKKLDKALEKLINVIFYFILTFSVVGALGMNPLVLFASISAFILGFAFMIGTACSKYIEGLLLIFVRRPYDIGDLIHVGDPNSESPFCGTATWIVKDINLFTTTVIYFSTYEVATYSNSSLASSRIINAARSPAAVILIYLKFPIDTPYEKFQVFKACLKKFMKERPREWLTLWGFRCTRVEAEQAFVEYIIVAQHRESWQHVLPLLDAKAELSSFALELSKKMNMRYYAPPVPVQLRVGMGNGDCGGDTTMQDGQFPLGIPGMSPLQNAVVQDEMLSSRRCDPSCYSSAMSEMSSLLNPESIRNRMNADEEEGLLSGTRGQQVANLSSISCRRATSPTATAASDFAAVSKIFEQRDLEINFG